LGNRGLQPHKRLKQLFFFLNVSRTTRMKFIGSDYDCKEIWALKNDQTDIKLAGSAACGSSWGDKHRTSRFWVSSAI
jgi:hypothetical protein